MIMISTPYSNSDPEIKRANHLAAIQMCEKMIHLKEHAFSPVVYGLAILEKARIPLPDDWNFWQGYCESLIKLVNKVYVIEMPGWKNSSGVAGEISAAKKFNVPVFLIEFDTDLNTPVKIIQQL